jgi:hypothetical protein
MVRVRPSLIRTVPSAGDAGGELARTESSCRRYLIGDSGCLEGEAAWFRVGEESSWTSLDIVIAGALSAIMSAAFRADGDLLS